MTTGCHDDGSVTFTAAADIDITLTLYLTMNVRSGLHIIKYLYLISPYSEGLATQHFADLHKYDLICI